jgi:hypothetical protein
MVTLPNGNSIDLDMLEVAMDDSDPTHRYFLNLVTGEVVFFSDDLGSSDEDERVESHKVVPTHFQLSLTKSYRPSCEESQAVTKSPTKMRGFSDSSARLARPQTHPSTKSS